MTAARRGRFITLEGGEGAGKSTNLATLTRLLKERGHAVVQTREPGGTPVAEAIRELLLADHEETLVPMAELLLIFAARAQHLAKVVRPALERGSWVVCDRFTDATYAYQGAARGLGRDTVAAVERLVHPDLQPDLTFFLDLNPAQGRRRTEARGATDRFEREADPFYHAVRDAYLERARSCPDRFRLLDASQPLPQVAQQLQSTLESWLREAS